MDHEGPDRFENTAPVLLWTRYVIAYLESNTVFGTLLRYVGWVFFAFTIIAVVINIFHPVMFWFDESGAYHAGSLRCVTLIAQILMFLRHRAIRFALRQSQREKSDSGI